MPGIMYKVRNSNISNPEENDNFYGQLPVTLTFEDRLCTMI